ncbi:MAG: cysteine desulfurase [Ignavibacteria bacterium]|nr:cysteine desulfurase [Ignavibacteria bacterium]
MNSDNKQITDTVPFDVRKVREDFPILAETVHGKPLVYFDNAATTHKPLQVINRLQHYYLHENSNIHRGVHALSQHATGEYEKSRRTIQKFINASSEKEIIFTRGTTESINLVAQSFGAKFIAQDDEIIISGMEHHSNIVPWQLLCERTGARLKILPFDLNGELQMEELPGLITAKTKLISVVHASNSLGTVNPVEDIIALAHSHGIPVLIDGAQAVQHMPVDVQKLDCDFYVFSGHKLYGPTGIGVLYGKTKYLEAMPPYQGGGDMILSVTFDKTIYNELPYKFEAGTPDIAGGIGLGAAIDYLNTIGMDAIAAYEHQLSDYVIEKFTNIDKVQLIGNAKKRVGSFSFILDGIHPHDIGTILDFDGIAIRTGHHCTQPVMQRFCIPATARLSLGIYNTREEIDFFVQSIHKVFEVFS